MSDKIMEMIYELRNICPQPNEKGMIFLNDEQIKMFEKTLQKYEYGKYKNKEIIFLKKRS